MGVIIIAFPLCRDGTGVDADIRRENPPPISIVSMCVCMQIMIMSLSVLFNSGHYAGGRGLIIILAFSLFREGGFNNNEQLILLAFTLFREG